MPTINKFKALKIIPLLDRK